MARLCGFAILLCAATAVASAQDLPPEPDEPTSPPAPAEEPPSPEPAQPANAIDSVEPDQPTPAPPPTAPTREPAPRAPEPPPKAAPQQQRYEGQISEGESSAAPAHEPDPDAPDQPFEPEPERGDGSELPGFSIRLDPLNWLIEGRLGIELEVTLWKFISAELVPVFVANTEPPAFNFSGRADPISQHSNGLGPIAGSSLGAGFWLSGTPFEGYVIRAILTNYGFTYRASDGSGTFDEVEFTERRLMAFFGSHSRWGVFTIAGGIGLGYELNQQQRCGLTRARGEIRARSVNCGEEADELRIALDRLDPGDSDDLNGVLHPMYIEGRFSLGVAFD